MPPAPLAAPLAAPLVVHLLALIVCASGLHSNDVAVRLFIHKDRNIRALGTPDVPHGCLYEGRWHTEGTVVKTREACLRCACARGALACRRRACSPLPDPPPRRCHVLHRKDSCCPELHCPDGVRLMEHDASARFEDDTDIATPTSTQHACVEGGTIFAAGSAMASNTACEQCFCLGGARRCIRPRCLPPPPGCRARPTPGACCPQRYYCEHTVTVSPNQKHPHDCEMGGELISEGERVRVAEKSANCTQCFCLRGSVRCQPLACAPPLLGCTPLLRPGQCCPHQYHCQRNQHGPAPHMFRLSDNSLTPTRYDDRSFHSAKPRSEPSTTTVSTILPSTMNTPTISATNESITTAKVKRKTDEEPPSSSSRKPFENVTDTITTTHKIVTKAAKLVVTTEATTIDDTTEILPTEQPEGTVKIMINGTINCTAELSSTSLPLNITVNDTDKANLRVEPRIPYIDISGVEVQTSNPNDIITDRNVGGFDENETFTINVTSSLTSSLRSNASDSTPGPSMSTVSKISVPTDIAESLNISKKTKGDYDYDYTEPTLPPSLPNLKIIPFVAADAVVDDDVSSKESLSYPILEAEDKFPVYYPSIESKETSFPARREDYNPTQYPVFLTDKGEASQYPIVSHEVNLSGDDFSSSHNDLATLHDYTVSTAIGSHVPVVNKVVTPLPSTTTTFGIETPAVNLFSPPVETEGGFIPKGPGIIDEYYAVYPSTPSGSSVPHLTTSMQLDISKGECITDDDRRVSEGETISIACSLCTCAWGELHCSPRPCHIPPGCRRRPASTVDSDICCGDLVCENDNKSIPITTTTTQRIDVNKTLINKNLSEPSLIEGFLNIDKSTSKPIVIAEDRIDVNISDDNTDNRLNETVIEEKVDNVLSETSSTQTTAVPTPVSTTTLKPIETNNHTNIEHSQPDSSSQEDDEDEGFNFESIFKLLLSDNYDTITTNKKTTTSVPKTTTAETTTTPSPPPTTTTTELPLKPMAPFIPLPHLHYPYIPPKKSPPPQNTVNRIDHLVLGEATAIKKTTPRPITTFRPVTAKLTTRPTTLKIYTSRPTEVTKKQETVHTTTKEVPRAPNLGLSGVGPGLLKLAGCNIYGRMYRVGRIIAELSTPCQECWCTEFGVQCKSLNC